MKPLKITKKYHTTPLWKRVVAYLIDNLIISMFILYPFNNYFTNLGSNIIDILKNELQITAGAAFSAVLLTWLYFILLEITTRQTIGKMAMNIYVASLRKDLNITQIILRNITKPFTLILAIDTLYMIFKKTNQRLFEVFSGTIVIEQEVIMK